MKIIVTEHQLKLISEQTTPIKKLGTLPLDVFVNQFLRQYIPILGDLTADKYNKYMEDGKKIYNDFADIVNRRIEYNRKNNLPLDKMTPEEIEYRKKIRDSTPMYGYPGLSKFLDLISDIKSGKKYVDKKVTSSNKAIETAKSREDLRNLWLGLEDIDHLSNGTYMKSEFKPSIDAGNIQYIRPKKLPKLNQQEFDLFYDAIMKTRRPDGTFPGGNHPNAFKNLDLSVSKDISRKIVNIWSGGMNDLGKYKLGAGEDNGRRFISVYDKWDLEPPALKKLGIDIQKFGNTPYIYFRIYRP
jgi:hypothetical protein